MIFKGRILGGAQNFHRDPYLNATTILFDSADASISKSPTYVSNLLFVGVTILI